MKEELILNLEEMRRELNILISELNSSGTERTAHFLRYIGKDCEYYKKSISLFMRDDYDKIRKRIIELHRIIGLIDG